MRRGRNGISRRAGQQRWRATLAAGAIVLAAVVSLLEALRRAVADVEAAVDQVWTAGKQLAQQTQAGHLLQTTKARTRSLLEELTAADQITEQVTEEPT